ncbi:MliC family protein [Vibrio cholerae]
MNKHLALWAVAGLMLGCAQSEQASAPVKFHTYQCDEGKQFSAAYLSGEEAALVKVEGKSLRLTQLPSGSGSRYALMDDGQEVTPAVNLAIKGNEARLNYQDQRLTQCVTD